MARREAAESARPEEVIERIQDLGLPPETAEVFNALTDEGARVFSREIMHALLRAQAHANLRPVRDVVEAWYRTLLMKDHPYYSDSVRWAMDEDRVRESIPAEDVVEHAKN